MKNNRFLNTSSPQILPFFLGTGLLPPPDYMMQRRSRGSQSVYFTTPFTLRETLLTVLLCGNMVCLPEETALHEILKPLWSLLQAALTPAMNRPSVGLPQDQGFLWE